MSQGHVLISRHNEKKPVSRLLNMLCREENY